MNRKIFWVNTANRNTLAGRAEVGLQLAVGLNESDIDPIQAWCEQHSCGKRISFDMFKFRNKKEITMFLLKWG